MATSARVYRRSHKGGPLIGFVVGKYFAMNPDRTPDFNGITRNIEEAVVWAIKLWQAGFCVFLPHLNTHHFEAKTRIDPDPIENEEYYRAFDRKLLTKAIDFLYATPNWRGSTGGRLEVQLACHLDVPVFESVQEVQTWAGGDGLYSTVRYNTVSEEAKHFGEGKNLPIVIIDGPFWAQNGEDYDLPAIRQYAYVAEQAAIQCFNAKIPAFTPHLNANFERLGYRVPEDTYHLMEDEILNRVADCMLLLPGWEGVPRARARVSAARTLGKPAFTAISEMCEWRAGNPYATALINQAAAPKERDKRRPTYL